MKLLILDNYDSFTFNLYHEVGELLTAQTKTFDLVVKRNDAITIKEIKKQNFDRIIISPGPGDPSNQNYFGVCADVITDIGRITPVLGVCLGMQGIGYYFGGRVIKAPLPRHGKTSLLSHDGLGLFQNLPQNIEVMRYHSLMVEKSSLPEVLAVSATAIDEGQEIIMGLRHKTFPIEGVQFHPESFATEGGKKMLENFLFSNI